MLAVRLSVTLHIPSNEFVQELIFLSDTKQNVEIIQYQFIGGS